MIRLFFIQYNFQTHKLVNNDKKILEIYTNIAHPYQAEILTTNASIPNII